MPHITEVVSLATCLTWFAVLQVTNSVGTTETNGRHTDSWDSDTMTGKCDAEWKKIEGKWTIVSDKITYKMK